VEDNSDGGVGLGEAFFDGGLDLEVLAGADDEGGVSFDFELFGLVVGTGSECKPDHNRRSGELHTGRE